LLVRTSEIEVTLRLHYVDRPSKREYLRLKRLPGDTVLLTSSGALSAIERSREKTDRSLSANPASFSGSGSAKSVG
jgi:hypothetical protein